MFGSHREILKQVGNLALYKSSQHGYGFTKSGRGTIKTRITYSIEYTTEYLLSIDIESPEHDFGFSFATLSEAKKQFKALAA